MSQKIYSGNILGKNGLQFSIIDTDLTSLIGRDAIYIDSETRFKSIQKSDQPVTELQAYFDSVEQLDPIILYDREGDPERKFLVYHLKGYKGL